MLDGTFSLRGKIMLKQLLNSVAIFGTTAALALFSLGNAAAQHGGGGHGGGGHGGGGHGGGGHGGGGGSHGGSGGGWHGGSGGGSHGGNWQGGNGWHGDGWHDGHGHGWGWYGGWYGWYPGLYGSRWGWGYPYYGSGDGSGYSDYGYGYPEQYYGDTTGDLSQQQPANQQNTAHIRVLVPADNAQIWFDDAPTQQTGSVRVFDTPALEPGRSYTYQVRARWTDNGREVAETREAHIHPGDAVTVDFTNQLPPPRPRPDTNNANPLPPPRPRPDTNNANPLPPRPRPDTNNANPGY
jgi:uncharacterized protein (TIGR03000 family)